MNHKICQQCKHLTEKQIHYIRWPDWAAPKDPNKPDDFDENHLETEGCCYLLWDENPQRPDGNEDCIIFKKNEQNGSIKKNDKFIMPEGCPYKLEHIVEGQSNVIG